MPPPAQGGGDPGVSSFPISSRFLPHSAPPLGEGGRVCVCQVCRYPGRSHCLHACPRAGLVRVASQTHAPRAPGAGRVPASQAQPLPSAPTGCKRNRRAGRASASVPDPHLGGLCPWAPCHIHVCVLCPPCVCAQVSKREREKFRTLPSLNLKSQQTSKTGNRGLLPTLHPPLPQPVFPLFFLPPATRARF